MKCGKVFDPKYMLHCRLGNIDYFDMWYKRDFSEFSFPQFSSNICNKAGTVLAQAFNYLFQREVYVGRGKNFN